MPGSHFHAARRVARWSTLAATLSVAACTPDISAPTHVVEPTAPRASAGPSASSDNVVVQWDAEALEAIRATRPGPPMVARMLFVAHEAMYDAWAAYDAQAVGTRLGGTLRRPAAERTAANKDRAISYAAYRTLLDLFPTRRAQLDARMVALGYDPNDASTDVATATGVGNAAAASCVAMHHGDGANQLGEKNGGAPYSDYTGYTPVNTPTRIVDPNAWQPLSVPNGSGGLVVQRYLAPYWGLVTPFALASASQFRPAALPYAYPDGGYHSQVNEIIAYSRDLNDSTKSIAEYWADGPASETPPGHWALFAQTVARRDAMDVDRSAKLFFALTAAIFDASIAVWDAKRAFASVRPVTAVHFLKAGQTIRAWCGPYRGTCNLRGEEWQPYQAATFVTPPFPEYISGHSAFSAAGAEVLASFTGSDAFGASVTIPAGSSRVEPGLVPARDVTLAWPTFSSAADEAGISRRYGGIHFTRGDVDARAIGRRVAALAWGRARAYFAGTATTLATR